MQNNALAASCNAVANEPETESWNVVALPSPTRLGRVPNPENVGPTQARRQRFRILEFTNASGSKAWRVQGMDRAGQYHRENFADYKRAQCRQVELDAAYLSRQPGDAALHTTALSEIQLRVAELAFQQIDRPEDLLAAVAHWKAAGRKSAANAVEAPRLDAAVSEFNGWLKTTPTLRARTKSNLRLRVAIFSETVGNMQMDAITPDSLEDFLTNRGGSPTNRDNDRRAISRFFSWCIERPRRWIQVNPAATVRVECGEKSAPSILTVEDCQKLLKAAVAYRKGRLVPYLAVCLFGGLRPFEASRLTWSHVNLADGEIRLEGNMTKTGRPRVVTIGPTLRAWLEAYKGIAFFPPGWRRSFDQIKRKAGFGPVETGLRPWVEDVLRHTAISHHFRQIGSYGQTAEQCGNSETIIKQHYQGRVTSEDTRQFFDIMPGKKSR